MNQQYPEPKEQLQTAEQLQPAESQPETTEQNLSAQAVGGLFETRRQDLTTMKQWVGLKFYYRVAEKIKQEEAALKRLLRIENAKQTILADYSFVLDPAYFEQKFLA